MKKMIKTMNLTFKDCIHYPNISIKENMITFICGPSGCGKSTLLKMINGTACPSAGHIIYKGEDISILDKIALRREIILLKQEPYLFPETVYQNYEEFHKIHESSCPSKAEIQNYLDICCLPIDLDKKCDTMSGGERQRLFLSIALSLNPKVLLLDEPTSAMNKELSERMIKNINEYTKAKKISLVIVSHDMKLKENFAEDIIELGCIK